MNTEICESLLTSLDAAVQLLDKNPDQLLISKTDSQELRDILARASRKIEKVTQHA